MGSQYSILRKKNLKSTYRVSLFGISFIKLGAWVRFGMPTLQMVFMMFLMLATMFVFGLGSGVEVSMGVGFSTGSLGFSGSGSGWFSTGVGFSTGSSA